MFVCGVCMCELTLELVHTLLCVLYAHVSSLRSGHTHPHEWLGGVQMLIFGCHLLSISFLLFLKFKTVWFSLWVCGHTHTVAHVRGSGDHSWEAVRSPCTTWVSGLKHSSPGLAANAQTCWGTSPAHIWFLKTGRLSDSESHGFSWTSGCPENSRDPLASAPSTEVTGLRMRTLLSSPTNKRFETSWFLYTIYKYTLKKIFWCVAPFFNYGVECVLVSSGAWFWHLTDKISHRRLLASRLKPLCLTTGHRDSSLEDF